MNFLQRLKFYGIGFGIGLLIVFAMFGNRSCVSTSEMKMQELVFQRFELSEKARCKLTCLRMNEALLKVQLRHFEVNYDVTEVHAKPCGRYMVEPSKEHRSEYSYNLVMNDCDSITKIDDINITGTNTCNCH